MYSNYQVHKFHKVPFEKKYGLLGYWGALQLYVVYPAQAVGSSIVGQQDGGAQRGGQLLQTVGELEYQRSKNFRIIRFFFKYTLSMSPPKCSLQALLLGGLPKYLDQFKNGSFYFGKKNEICSVLAVADHIIFSTRFDR